MLTCEKLVIQQGDFRLSADLSFRRDTVTALIGPSGAGKSTLLAALAGFTSATSGRILFDGVDLGPALPGARPVSILFQDNNLFPHLTLAQNVGLALAPRLRLTAQQHQAVRSALDHVGLADFANRRPSEVSGGQQSRAALARVLLADRPVVLLDEPFAALGPALKDDMLDLVAQKLRDRTVIMVTHNPADARGIAGDTAFVADGMVTQPVATTALLAAPPAALADYLGRASGSADT